MATGEPHITQSHFPIERVSDERLRQAVQILTTEHFALQSGRNNVTSEANGRLTIYLGALSGALIAIAFVAQVSRLGDAFHVFTLLILPALLLLGLATFGRVVQCDRQDLQYAAAINRIRHFYVELIPELGDYFVQSTYDDWDGMLRSLSLTWTRWHGFITASAAVAAMNAFVAGVLVGLLTSWLIGLPLAAAIACGFVVGIATMAIQARFGSQAVRRLELYLTPLFPSPKP